ncbi:Ohr family peroxiredoxin [Bradyrhizobium liaoningense]|uniref:Ohr family peroxiredoxin n=1 Tax=Bradyrhizobium liaoningense TaxID=43992 RepID=UPI001BA4486D|nr:Ohr family peroxiredoxin [Bradyrhizobium liaoningense]MBR1167516.1 Ohr family peroxiredoxin [Bradyrhizobium liaoningense]
MTKFSKVLHTARTRTTGGRERGISRSSDGYLDVRLATAGSDRIGTNPEHLFAAAWSACFETGVVLAAERRKISLPANITIDAEVDLNSGPTGHFLSARLYVALPGVDRVIAQSLIEEAHITCPYSKATRGNLEVEIRLIE